MDKLRKLSLLLQCIDGKMKFNDLRIAKAHANNRITAFDNENKELTEIRKELKEEFNKEYDKKYESPD